MEHFKTRGLLGVRGSMIFRVARPDAKRANRRQPPLTGVAGSVLLSSDRRLTSSLLLSVDIGGFSVILQNILVALLW